MYKFKKKRLGENMNEQIKKDLVDSMKNQDKFKTSVLRMLKSAIQSEAINKKHELNDDEVIAVIKKQVKVRTSSMEEYTKYNRTDLADDLKKEIEILNAYLPEELSDDEVIKIIDETINLEKAETIKDMGRVIKAIAATYGSRVDMGKISSLVKDKLNN